jgi:hypothetical protein
MNIADNLRDLINIGQTDAVANGLTDALHVQLLSHLRGHPAFTRAQRRGSHLGLLNRFFTAVRQHQWDTALLADAMFDREDYPKRAERLPRAQAEHVVDREIQNNLTLKLDARQRRA